MMRLDYDEVATLNITKDDIVILFVDPKISKKLEQTKPKLSIKWCANGAMHLNFWDFWWMVFDKPPHNNLEVPFYFIRKLYEKFVLGLKVNYWSMRPKMGVGGAPQDRHFAQWKKVGTFVPSINVPPPLV